ncbi:MAG TPA: chemotaxis protein CheA [Gammaproteobacteria bacterium]|nr:chemotaxis protein CheA [Gammaproteobacteria bacterium]
MSIDLEQFHQAFFEESFEGLDEMENELLELDMGSADSESINTIFRAAHSIKGGSATFGFTDVAEFTHRMETLLDEMRDGRREATSEAVNLLLGSVDCLRDLLGAQRDNSEADKENVISLQQQLDDMLSTGLDSVAQIEDSNAKTSKEKQHESSNSEEVEWLIQFHPHPHMLRTGNEPLRMFNELALLGELEVRVDSSKLPAFCDIAFDECYLSWELVLKGSIKREQITEIFEWVDDDCDLSIELKEVKTEVVPELVDEKEEVLQSIKKPKERRATPERRKSSSLSEASSIRVGIDKIDELVNLVSELVITQSMLSQTNEHDSGNQDKLLNGLAQLERNTRELQESVMRIRMLPISFAFNRFPRMVHDLTQKLDKKVELKMSGENTELDKTVMEKIGDPLVHLVRNSLDHGIETPEVRLQNGKPEVGVLHLNAYHQGGNIVIEISDDGAGLNSERIAAKAIAQGLIDENEVLTKEKIYELIFSAGFSTAETLSDVSGRGVGMDVVKRNIKDLGGSIEVTSEEGAGSTFTIRLPLTLAILDGQLIRVGDETYIIPLVSIEETFQVSYELINTIANGTELYRLRDEYIPIVRLYNIFNVIPEHTELTEGLLVVVESDGRKVGLFVDDLLGQQQVVIKGLEANFRRVEGVSGATILGDGTVSLILDIGGLIEFARNRQINAVA